MFCSAELGVLDHKPSIPVLKQKNISSGFCHRSSASIIRHRLVIVRIAEVKSKRVIAWAAIASTFSLLTGCGNAYEGTYRALDGFIGPFIVLEVTGKKAHATKVDIIRKIVISEEDFTAEDKGKKLLITNSRGKTFAFLRMVNEKDLECLNCGFGTGLPKVWQKVIKNSEI